MRHITITSMFLIALAVGPPGLTAQSGYDLFQKALATERAAGNLREAIQLYERVVKQFASDRPLVARALVRIADCYEKLGQRDAMKIYERIVREFSDQAESVSFARTRLSALQSAPRSHVAQSVRQAWSGAGVDPMGTPSGDGRYLSFTDWETGDLALRDLAEDTSRRLTSTGGWQASGDFAEYSVMSPDGRQIAYAWFTDKGSQPAATGCLCRYDLRVVSTAGGETNKPKLVLQTKNGNEWLRPVAWTPDAKQLLVIHALADRTSQLALVTLADNSQRVLKTFPWQGPETVSVSPNGQFVVYDAQASPQGRARDIFLLSLDGGREMPIVQAAANDRSPIWTADGGHVLFISDRTGTDSLWRIPMLNEKPSAAPVMVMSAISGNLLGSARSGAVFYWTGGQNTNVYLANLDANFIAKGSPTIAIERFLNSNNAPAWSPDGTQLAYLSRRGLSRAAGVTALMIHSVTTGEDREVPTRTDLADHVSWFPDGRSVLVASPEPSEGRFAFYRVDIATGDAQLLLRTKGQGFPVRRPEVSPDGRTIVYADRLNNNTDLGVGGDRLVRFEIASGQETELKKLDGSDGSFTSFAVAPDSAEVAYLRFDGARRWSILEVIPQRGGESRELFRDNNNTGSRYAGLAWTPDKRYIMVARTSGTSATARTAFWKVPASGGAAEETGISAPGMLRFPSFDPKGGRMAFAATGGGAEPAIWVVENFLPRVTR